MTTVDVNPLIGARLDESAALARTVELATRQAATGRLPFAALVVRDGVVLGGGVNTVLDDHDPSGHGEVVAVRDATRRLGTADLTGAVVYSSCEPCAICRLVAAAAGIGEIVYAADKSLDAVSVVKDGGLGTAAVRGASVAPPPSYDDFYAANQRGVLSLAWSLTGVPGRSPAGVSGVEPPKWGVGGVTTPPSQTKELGNHAAKAGCRSGRGRSESLWRANGTA